MKRRGRWGCDLAHVDLHTDCFHSGVISSNCHFRTLALSQLLCKRRTTLYLCKNDSSLLTWPESPVKSPKRCSFLERRRLISSSVCEKWQRFGICLQDNHTLHQDNAHQICNHNRSLYRSVWKHTRLRVAGHRGHLSCCTRGRPPSSGSKRSRIRPSWNSTSAAIFLSSKAHVGCPNRCRCRGGCRFRHKWGWQSTNPTRLGICQSRACRHSQGRTGKHEMARWYLKVPYTAAMVEGRFGASRRPSACHDRVLEDEVWRLPRKESGRRDVTLRRIVTLASHTSG